MTMHKRIAGTLLVLGVTVGLGVAAAALLNKPADAAKSDGRTTPPTSNVSDLHVQHDGSRPNPADTPGVNAFTDARYGDEPGPLTSKEQEKLAQAREAIAQAEAAGTRGMSPLERDPITFGADAERTKLERRRTKGASSTINPGVPSDVPAEAPRTEGGTR